MVLVLLLASVLAGCAPATRYRTLSFFFDGVPDPTALPAQFTAPVASAAAAAPSAPVAPLSRPGPRQYHKPYQDFQCGPCHGRDPGGQGQRLSKSVAEGLCYDCHKDLSKEVLFVHAPVLVNACLECHEPHLSNGPHLLLSARPNVCARCHVPADLSTGDHHRDAASLTDSTCISCHLPHGGPRRHLLRSVGG